MRTAAATPFYYWTCFSSQKPIAADPEQPTNVFAVKPKISLQKHTDNQQTKAGISQQFKEKILCLEIMGVDSGQALARNPSLREAPVDSINSVISFLQSKGVHIKDLGRIFGMCPRILTSNIKSDLDPVFSFLSSDLGVPDRNFRMVISKCPRLLISSVGDQLKPALSYLRKLGFRDLKALAYRDSILLVSNVERTLVPKLDYLVSLGISKPDAVRMVLRCPGLFTFSIENNLKPKFNYFAEEMKGKLGEVKEFPQYFTFSLEKRIKPRHMEVVRTGVKIVLPLMLKTSDQAFRELLTLKMSSELEANNETL
ncbi:transcription termination factor MTEF1, chloroplastic-like [Andrographis paniculata]|uniref:transcription termination factor MTEF1, chloroplastic-like n=1 Tax=Andrographis paniculata TaxID=175694 RepID=UPI0021E879A3|nr:transcription termination factor MTEF1, chloroplastic-like [Andrographis paniculata]